nr:MAG TPA: hypothetical protein [Caudoviricetes sp.]
MLVKNHGCAKSMGNLTKTGPGCYMMGSGNVCGS